MDQPDGHLQHQHVAGDDDHGGLFEVICQESIIVTGEDRSRDPSPPTLAWCHTENTLVPLVPHCKHAASTLQTTFVAPH